MATIKQITKQIETSEKRIANFLRKVDIWWSISDLDTDCADLVLYSIQWPKEFYEHNIKG